MKRIQLLGALGAVVSCLTFAVPGVGGGTAEDFVTAEVAVRTAEQAEAVRQAGVGEVRELGKTVTVEVPAEHIEFLRQHGMDVDHLERFVEITLAPLESGETSSGPDGAGAPRRALLPPGLGDIVFCYVHDDCNNDDGSGDGYCDDFFYPPICDCSWGDHTCPNESLCLDRSPSERSCYIPKDRYLSFYPRSVGVYHSYYVYLLASLYHPDAGGMSAYVGTPDQVTGIAGLEPAPVGRYWSSVDVHVGGCLISPSSIYWVFAWDGVELSDPLILATTTQPEPKYWGDAVGMFDGSKYTPPNGVVNYDDIQAAVKYFIAGGVGSGIPHLWQVDLAPQVPDQVLNFTDIQKLVDAFKSEYYPYGNASDPCAP